MENFGPGVRFGDTEEKASIAYCLRRPISRRPSDATEELPAGRRPVATELKWGLSLFCNGQKCVPPPCNGSNTLDFCSLLQRDHLRSS